MSYVILEKDGLGTEQIFDKKEAQELVNKGYTVRVQKTDWDLSPKKVSKKSKKK